MASRDDFATAIGRLLRERLTVPTTSLTTEDLNTLTRPGIYLQQLNADATVERHYPYANISGNLIVLPTNPGWSTSTQMYVPNNAFAAGFATRSFRAGAWSDWQTFDTRSTSDRRYMKVPNSSLTTEDLDTIVAPGLYMQQTNASATAALHYPFPEVSGNLLVMPMNPGQTLATQVWFSNNAFGTGIATRSFRAGSWSAWASIGGGGSVSVSAGALKIVPLALTIGQSNVNAQTSRGVRVPMRWNAPIGRWRLHVRNWNPRLGSIVTAAVSVTGLWLGEHNGSGGFVGTPTQIRGAFSTPADGSEWVSEWFDAPLGGDVERLLAYGYTTTTTSPYALGGGSYQFAEPERAGDPAYSTATTFTTTPLDLWVEAETPASTPVIAGVGDSLTGGTGATRPRFDSWVEAYARRVGGLPYVMAHHGDSMLGFLSTNPSKVTRWAGLARADAVVWALGSNDIGGGVDLATMQARFDQLLPIIEANVGPVRYFATVPPRNGWDSTYESVRTAWNTWLSARPQLRGVLDFAAVASADGDTLRPEYNSGDGTHLNTAGYAAEAASITVPLAGAMPASAARMTAVESALYDSGLRNITSLASNLESGKILFRVKNGRARVKLSGISTTVESATLFEAMTGALFPYRPADPDFDRGFVTAGATNQTYHVQINYNGALKLYGAPATTALNGVIEWDMDRTPPATPIGDPA